MALRARLDADVGAIVGVTSCSRRSSPTRRCAASSAARSTTPCAATRLLPGAGGAGRGRAAAPRRAPPAAAPRRPGGYAQLVRPNGNAIQLGPARRPDLPVTRQALATANGDAGGGFSDRDVDGLHLRVLTAPLGPIGAVQVARSLQDADRVLERLRRVLSRSWRRHRARGRRSRLFSRRVVAPVTELTEAAEHIEATGDLGRRIDADGHDEVGRMAARFNGMLARLQASQARSASWWPTPRTSCARRSPRCAPTSRSCATRRRWAEGDRRALLDDVVGRPRSSATSSPTSSRWPATARRRRRPRTCASTSSWPRPSSARAATPGVAFTLRAEPCVVSAAPDRIGRAVNNLLDNAATARRPRRGHGQRRRRRRRARPRPRRPARGRAARLRSLLPRRQPPAGARARGSAWPSSARSPSRTAAACASSRPRTAGARFVLALPGEPA